MANGLYSPAEISRMTPSGLDELLEYYQDTGNTVGVLRVEQELASRENDQEAEAERQAELAWEAEEDRKQRAHDEMIDSMLAEQGRWG